MVLSMNVKVIMGVVVYEKALSSLVCTCWCVSGFLLWECDKLFNWLIPVLAGFLAGYFVSAFLFAWADYNDIKNGRSKF